MNRTRAEHRPELLEALSVANRIVERLAEALREAERGRRQAAQRLLEADLIWAREELDRRQAKEAWDYPA